MEGMARCCGAWILDVERMRPAVPVDGLELWPRCDMAGECEEEPSSETFSELFPSLRRRMDSAADDLLRL